MASRVTRQSVVVMVQPVTYARVTRLSITAMVTPAKRRGPAILTAPVGVPRSRRPKR